MDVFYQQLQQYNRKMGENQHFVFVLYDQLNDDFGFLTRWKPSEITLILVESLWKGKRRGYHKQKLALLLSNQRHFALEQTQKGVHVLYVSTSKSYADALKTIHEDHSCKQILMMEAAEREIRHNLQPLIVDNILKTIPHEGFLTRKEDLLELGTQAPWRMDAFYQRLRRRTGLLMEDGKPIGGKYSFDAENRLPWKGEPKLPLFPEFAPDAITQEVIADVQRIFPTHWGEIEPMQLPSSKEDCLQLWEWVKRECMEFFGPYEDAMHSTSEGLFHSRISALLNLHRILPRQIVKDIANLDIPLNSKEGFIRQVLGWREFMWQLHQVTDGFRSIARKEEVSVPSIFRNADGEDMGSDVNELQAHQPLPAAFWGRPSGLNCLDHIVQQVKDTGYTHHIPRLMVLANLATLLEIHPREITDWFWVAFVDAFEWVVEPNVLGMGTFATGEVLSTKPYVAGSGYIHKMSDFGKNCQFHPQKNCPLTPMYWVFIRKHQDRLSQNFRMNMVVKNALKQDAKKQLHQKNILQYCQKQLERGERIVLANIEKLGQ